MSECVSFAPLVDDECRVLILGSMPGRRSLDMQEYYAHPQNRFWRLLALLLNEEMPLTYADKCALLLRHHIALWDTLGYCEREGSLDSDIKNEQPNAVCELLAAKPQIKAVFCNGGKAAAAFKRYFAKSLPREVAVYYFSSTSPANARKRLENLAQEWQILLQYLR